MNQKFALFCTAEIFLVLVLVGCKTPPHMATSRSDDTFVHDDTSTANNLDPVLLGEMHRILVLDRPKAGLSGISDIFRALFSCLPANSFTRLYSKSSKPIDRKISSQESENSTRIERSQSPFLILSEKNLNSSTEKPRTLSTLAKDKDAATSNQTIVEGVDSIQDIKFASDTENMLFLLCEPKELKSISIEKPGDIFLDNEGKQFRFIAQGREGDQDAVLVEILNRLPRKADLEEVKFALPRAAWNFAKTR